MQREFEKEAYNCSSKILSYSEDSIYNNSVIDINLTYKKLYCRKNTIRTFQYMISKNESMEDVMKLFRDHILER